MDTITDNVARKLEKGTRVTYVTSYGKNENGIVKSVCEDGKHAFVTYNCPDWSDYMNYTGARTEISDLRIGWNAVY